MSQDQAPATPHVPDDHRRDELVIGISDLHVVGEMLAGLGVTWALKGSSRGSDVNLLAKKDQADLLGLARLRNIQDADHVPLDVGDVLAFVRQRFAANRDGWTPVMGKNRFVNGVIGEGHKPHAENDPVPVDTPAHVTVSTAGSGAGSGVRVGVVDTPLGIPALTKSGLYPFRAGHGRFVTDLITQQAPGIELRHAKILKGPDARADSWTTANAIVKLAEKFKPHVLNLSLGCYTFGSGPPLVISRAIERLDPSILVVAAAGNHGDFWQLMRSRDRRSAIWPAGLPRTIAVGAAEAPSWSPQLPWVDVVAPGVDVVAAYFGSKEHPVKVELYDGTASEEFTGHAQWSGTSFAAAFVSGAVAANMAPGFTAEQTLVRLLDEGVLVQRYSAGSMT